jgi:type II secretory pathway pseudopilin PulG
MSRRAGFTLIELCLSIGIALLLLTAAIPSIQGLFAEQQLRRTFDEFDELVRQAQARSTSERRDFVLVWDEKGVALQPDVPREGEENQDSVRLDFPEGASLVLERPAALGKEPPMEWIFWRSGNCEPAIVRYDGAPGSWVVKYDPLTTRGTFLEQMVK